MCIVDIMQEGTCSHETVGRFVGACLPIYTVSHGLPHLVCNVSEQNLIYPPNKDVVLRALIWVFFFSFFFTSQARRCRRHIADYNSRPADCTLLSLTYSPTVGFLVGGWEGRLKECAMFHDLWTYAIFLCPAMSLASLFCCPPPPPPSSCLLHSPFFL